MKYWIECFFINLRNKTNFWFILSKSNSIWFEKYGYLCFPALALVPGREFVFISLGPQFVFASPGIWHSICVCVFCVLPLNFSKDKIHYMICQTLLLYQKIKKKKKKSEMYNVNTNVIFIWFLVYVKAIKNIYKINLCIPNSFTDICQRFWLDFKNIVFHNPSQWLFLK